MKKFCPFIPLFSLLLEEAGISSVTDELFPLRTMQSPFCPVPLFFRGTDASFSCYFHESGPSICMFSISISIIWIPDSICSFLFGFCPHDTGGDQGSGSRDEEEPQPSEKGELTLVSKQQNKWRTLYSFVLLINDTTKSLANTRLAIFTFTPVVFMKNRK